MVLVAIPHKGYLRVELSQFLTELDKKPDYEIHYSHSRPVDTNRNKIVNYFLEETDHDTLMMIDSDIVPPENVTDILEYDFDVISPVVFSTKDGIPYPVATQIGEDGNYRMYTGSFDDVIEVEGVGTGCVAISREVLEDLDQPIFEFTKDDDGTLNTSEDFNFCVKVNEAGYDVKVATRYTCGHLTEVDLHEMMKSMSLALDSDKSAIFAEEVGDKNENKED